METRDEVPVVMMFELNFERWALVSMMGVVC